MRVMVIGCDLADYSHPQLPGGALLSDQRNKRRVINEMVGY